MTKLFKKYNYLQIVILLVLLTSCSSTKTHVVYNGIVKLNTSEFITYNEGIEKNNQDSLSRGKFPKTTWDQGNSNVKSEYAVIFQSIGKIKWKNELGLSFKSMSEGNGFQRPTNEYDLSEALVKASYPVKLDIGINYNLNSFDDYVRESKTINSLADDQNKIDYSKGYIPIMYLSDYLVTPYAVQSSDKPLSGNNYIASTSRLNSPICLVDSNVNLGHLTLVAAKKYNDVNINSKVLYDLLQYLNNTLNSQYRCNALLSYYLDMFDPLEIKEMTRLNIAKDAPTFFHITKMYSCLNDNMHFPYISSFPNYSFESNIHEVFIKHYNDIYSKYENTLFLENGFVDSVVINKIELNSLTKSMDSIAILLDKDYLNIASDFSILFDKMVKSKNDEEAKNVFKRVGLIAENLDRKSRYFENISELVTKIKDRQKISSYKANGVVFSKKLNDLLLEIEKAKNNSMKYYKINLDKYNSIVNNMDKHIAARKADIINQYIDNIIALQPGSVMKFTPFSLDYIDEIDNSKTALTNPVVLVKKIDNVNRSSVLVKVLHLPIPEGFNSNRMRVEYSLALGAEVVLPISEFEDFPGNSSNNQLMEFLDSLR